MSEVDIYKKAELALKNAYGIFLDHDERLRKASSVTAGFLSSLDVKGMDDDSYNNAVSLLKKLKITLDSFKEERSPVTQAAQAIVKAFTSQENAIDVTKPDTDAYKIKKHMDEYAAKKMKEKALKEEQERKRIERERELNTVQIATMTFLQKVCQKSLDMVRERIKALQDSLSLENYDEIRKELLKLDTNIPESLLGKFDVEIRTVYIGTEEKKRIMDSIMEMDEWNTLQMDYYKEASIALQEAIAYLPTIKKELEEIEKSSAERAEALRKEKMQREFEESQRLKAERERAAKALEDEEKERLAKAQMQSEFDFGASIANLDTNIKTKNSWEIQLTLPVGLLEIVKFWVENQSWPQEQDKVMKVTFDRMVRFAENEATKNSNMIKSDYVKYVPKTISKL